MTQHSDSRQADRPTGRQADRPTGRQADRPTGRQADRPTVSSAGNRTLSKAKKDKNDEFYTQLVDIENELRHYRDQLRGKTIFCNCDDPFESNFFRYFALNFNTLGLKKLIATCHVKSSIAGAQLPLFDMEGLKPEGKLPYAIEINAVPDHDGDGATDLADVEYLLRHDANSSRPLEGDADYSGGDFRSRECVALLEEADIVVTNPPFSLFREYVAQLVDYGKQFLIIGNQNAITYKGVFTFIKNNKMWLGIDNGGTKWFRVPNDYDIQTESRKKIKDGVKYFSMGSVVWFTNMDNPKRHDSIPLFKKYSSAEYPAYDNYDAIDVARVADIPIDYDGVMGVPITFLDKYNPEHFELVGSNRDVGQDPSGVYGRGSMLHGKETFKRLFIRRKTGA
ncbi:hypothetical protein GGR90_002217 [Sphingopyxis italica]|uniref:Modification methylase n=1 Tax=Sphingopyxis italica TaxID=1129133 RepID=A0A7X5XRN3_9SPHN|nr:hypothetical protein [Sphingopyxis italica]